LTSSDYQGPDRRKPGRAVVEIPLTLSYVIVAGAMSLIGAGSWYMATQAGDIRDLNKHIASLEQNYDQLKKEGADARSQLRKDEQDADSEIKRQVSELRAATSASTDLARTTVTEVNNRLIRIEAQVNFLASQIPAASPVVVAPKK
jgi:outer membrane murein-binding lipoprotein Lpp